MHHSVLSRVPRHHRHQSLCNISRLQKFAFRLLTGMHGAEHAGDEFVNTIALLDQRH